MGTLDQLGHELDSFRHVWVVFPVVDDLTW